MTGSFDNFLPYYFARIPEECNNLRCYLDGQLTYHGQLIYHQDTVTVCDAHPPLLAVSNVAPDAWRISPNPASDFLHITGPSGKPFSYSLSSITGRQWLLGTAQAQAALATQALPNGLYFLQMKTEGSAFTQKVIIAH